MTEVGSCFHHELLVSVWGRNHLGVQAGSDRALTLMNSSNVTREHLA